MPTSGRARLVGSKQASLLHTHQTPPCLYPCIARAFRLIPPHITVQQTDHNTEAFPSKAPSNADPHWAVKVAQQHMELIGTPAASSAPRHPLLSFQSRNPFAIRTGYPTPGTSRTGGPGDSDSKRARARAQERQRSLRDGIHDNETDWAISALSKIRSCPILNY
ncbi:unnamed protein product, partial [Tilletia controversa]